MKNTNHGIQQRRLRTAVKHLVIELGYWNAAWIRLLDPDIHNAALHIYRAVDRLNDYLAVARHTQQAA